MGKDEIYEGRIYGSTAEEERVPDREIETTCVELREREEVRREEELSQKGG